MTSPTNITIPGPRSDCDVLLKFCEMNEGVHKAFYVHDNSFYECIQFQFQNKLFERIYISRVSKHATQNIALKARMFILQSVGYIYCRPVHMFVLGHNQNYIPIKRRSIIKDRNN